MATSQIHSQIPLPAPLNINSNLPVDWKRFKGQWANYVKAAKLNVEPKDRQAAILLACIGSNAYTVYTTFQFENKDDCDDPEKLCQAFERYCVGELNVVYERYVFNRRQQEPGETFDSFVGDLRQLVKSCEYATVEDSIVRDRIVLGIRDDVTRRKLLQARTLDLKSAIDICRAAETTSRQFKSITTPDETTIALRHQPHQRSSSRHRRYPTPSGRRPPVDGHQTSFAYTEQRCKYCNRDHERRKEACLAFGKVCKSCGKKNHFAIACRSKAKSAVCELSSESLLSLTSANDKHSYSHVLVEGQKCKFLLDCGSTVNLLPSNVLPFIHKTVNDLRPSRSVLRMFDQSQLATLRMLTATVQHPKTKAVVEVEFYVTASNDAILGIDICRRLDLVRIVEENICATDEIKLSPPGLSSKVTPSISSHSGRLTEGAIMERYADVFDGRLGLLEGEVHLDVDPTVRPVQMPLRRLPVAVRDHVDAELKKLVDDDVIAPVTTPTPWVSALLVTAKPTGYRICIDPKPLNKALKRSHYYMTTIDDVLPKLANVKVFSTVDVKSAFWTLKLDEPSSFLTTFETPFGRFRWLRCPYGISPAPEIFAARLHEAILGLQGIHCIADDMLITGSGETEAEAEIDHDRNLLALLDRCRERGIKLNKSKIKLKSSTSIPWMGHLITTQGLKPDPRKVEAIVKMPEPRDDKKALQRILGMATFLGRYCPNFSDVTSSMRELLHEKNEYKWQDRHSEAFSKLKRLLSAEPVLAYYRPDKPLICQCDSSQSGLGAVLLQDGKVIEYASRMLQKSEIDGLAQIEKELLSIYFGLSRFDSYCYGRKTIVENDHKPLLAIYKKSLAASPKRLQRMWLKLQRYDFDLVIKTSSQVLLADTLSRSYPPTPVEGTVFDEELAALTAVDEQDKELQMVASPETINIIKKAAAADVEYAGLIAQIMTGWPNTDADVAKYLRPYATSADKLSVSSGLVYKGCRLHGDTSTRPRVRAKQTACRAYRRKCVSMTCPRGRILARY
jgi:hypothetical protein